MSDDVDTARGSLLALVAAVALATLAGPAATPAAAHAGAYQLTLEASEDCPDRTYCFEVTEGSLDEITPGEEIQVTLVNPESNDLEHNVKVTPLQNADPDRETDDAKAGTDDLQPGEEASFEYFVPQGVDGLYLWCDFGVHEGQGMYLEASFGGDGASTSGQEETNGSPGPGALAALAGLAAVALLARRT